MVTRVPLRRQMARPSAEPRGEGRDAEALRCYALDAQSPVPPVAQQIAAAVLPLPADVHVACYHDGLEPFMARGRALRAQGVTGSEIDSVRFREVRSGTLSMPAHGTLYSLTRPKAGYDAATNALTGPRPLAVIYVPGATPESLGLSSHQGATPAAARPPSPPCDAASPRQAGCPSSRRCCPPYSRAGWWLGWPP